LKDSDRIFSEKNSLQELLGVAIKSEVEAAEIYRKLSNRDLPEGTKEKVETLVEQEERHEETFWSIIDDFFPDEEVSIPDQSGISNPVELKDDITLDELFEIAMASERESESFYKELKERFEDPAVCRMLGFLAASEREHYEILKQERQEID